MRTRLQTLLSERSLFLLLSFATATALWFFVGDAARPAPVNTRPGTVMKTVAVLPTISGIPADGFAVREIMVRPATVTLSGPRGILAEIDVVATGTVFVDGAGRDVEQSVDLRLPPGVFSSGSVTVTVNIVPMVARSLIANVPVTLQGLPGGFRVVAEPTEITLEVEGAPAAIGMLRPADLQVAVDVSALGPGIHSARPRVRSIPQGVRVTGVHPPVITVSVSRG